MKLHRSITGLLPILLLCGATVTFAQSDFGHSDDDLGRLYFPPKLALPAAYNSSNLSLLIIRSISYDSTLPLPVLFFDHPGEWTIAPRYQVFTGSFYVDDYADTNAIQGYNKDVKYLEILNIIGYRMRQYPLTTIHLQGGYSTEPGENEEVARTRVEIVKEYLTSIWKIEPERIALLAPERGCDSTDHIFRQQEARRVMILTDNWELLEPVRFARKNTSAHPLNFMFTLDPYVPSENIKEIGIVMTANDKIICQTTISGSTETLPYRLSGLWSSDNGDILQTFDAPAIAVTAEVRLNDGTIRSSNPAKIDVRILSFQPSQMESAGETLTLPFFAFRDSTLTEYHHFLIDKFIAELKPNGPIAAELSGRADYSEDTAVSNDIAARYTNSNLLALGRIVPSSSTEGEEVGQLRIWKVSSPTYGSQEVIFNDDWVLKSVEGQINWSEEGGIAIDDSSSTIHIPNKFTSDSLAIARKQVVKRFFQDSLKVALSTLDEIPGSYSRASSITAYLPEQRWLARSVVMKIIPYEEFLRQRSRAVKEKH